MASRAGYSNSWAKTINSHATSFGATVTPGNNTYGSYAQVLAATSDDAYWVDVFVTGVAVSGAAKDGLITIGVDPAGGSSYTDTITDLLVSCAPTSSLPGFLIYSFPLFIKAGSTIAAKGTVNTATVGTITVAVRLRCKPTRPELVRVGSYVRTFGSTPGSSAGTSVTPGNAGTKGTWVQMGSNTVDNLWFYQLGLGINNATMNNNLTGWDVGIGDGSNKATIVDDQWAVPNTAETLVTTPRQTWWESKTGDGIWVRAAAAGTALTGWSAAVYAVGG